MLLCRPTRRATAVSLARRRLEYGASRRDLKPYQSQPAQRSEPERLGPGSNPGRPEVCRPSRSLRLRSVPTSPSSFAHCVHSVDGLVDVSFASLTRLPTSLLVSTSPAGDCSVARGD